MTALQTVLSDSIEGTEIPILPVTFADLDDPKKVTEKEKNWMTVQSFTGKKGEVCLISNQKGQLSCVFLGLGDQNAYENDPWWLAPVVSHIPAGRYALAPHEAISDASLKIGALGWVLAHYDFAVYKENTPVTERILCLGGLLSNTDSYSFIIHTAQAVSLVRDMVNTPAADMTPQTLEQIVHQLASEYQATLSVTAGQELEEDFPAIHAVGQAAAIPPRLIELNWDNSEKITEPTEPAEVNGKILSLTLVGKGVCFDTGGLNLKPGGSMSLMKKDMGGAAHAIALASLIMAENLPIKLQLLIPAVENSVAGNAFRPGDIIDTRQGITVEIGNTDAEGRLILCDALTYASESQPDMIIDFATLTGAARVALGPDLPATYSNEDTLWSLLEQSSQNCGDPLWRMPLWTPYDDMLSSDIADMNNISAGPFAGSITAALYLQRFIGDDIRWIHFDTFAWNPTAKAGRPKGGEAQGLRATFDFIKNMTHANDMTSA